MTEIQVKNAYYLIQQIHNKQEPANVMDERYLEGQRMILEEYPMLLTHPVVVYWMGLYSEVINARREVKHEVDKLTQNIREFKDVRIKKNTT